MPLLCGEGLCLLLGLVIVIAGSFRLYGRYLYGWRRVLTGLVLMLQAPLAIFVGLAVLGDTPPGSINGAEAGEARIRFLALLAEWSVFLLAVGAAFFAWITAPKEPPNLDFIMEEEDDNQNS